MNKQYLHKNAHSILLNDAEIYDRKTMDKKSYFEKFDKKAIENRLSAFLNRPTGKILDNALTKSKNNLKQGKVRLLFFVLMKLIKFLKMIKKYLIP